MKATEELKNEHEGIQLMLRVLDAVSKKMELGEKIQNDHLDSMLEFFSVFVDKCHHGKEEDFLFPAMEKAGVIRENGPIEVMFNEHDMGRSLMSRISDAVTQYKSGNTSQSDEFGSASTEYVALLTRHIDKENNILFPMADMRLTPQEDQKLMEAFEKLEQDRIGPGKHEEFHHLLNRLELQYLG
jgi:hemerythrin-like domain-containing protein